MKIVIFGLGYVGLSNAVLLAQQHTVTAVDVVKDKVEKVNNKTSPIVDKDIEFFLKNEKLDLYATTNWEVACQEAELVIIATPTNYDPETKYFDTSSVEQVIKNVRSVNKNVTLVIKSTIPVGYVESLRKAGYESVVFVPEFLREGKALHDNLYPSRIIVGQKDAVGLNIANLFKDCARSKEIPILLTEPTEAEAIKLFANTYLAMRVAYFNELDTFACLKNLNTKDLIQGVGLDPRIGLHYCNPSFGYGGYCLPKDTKQLLANYDNVPSTIIKAIIDSNNIRKQFVADMALRGNHKNIGIYRLVMKSGSDNFRSAAVLDIIKILKDKGANIFIYEPTLNGETYDGCPIIKSLEKFSEDCEIILANRLSKELEPYQEKVLSRDIFRFE